MLGAIVTVKGLDAGAAHCVHALKIRQNIQFQGSPVGQQQTGTVRGIVGSSSELN